MKRVFRSIIAFLEWIPSKVICWKTWIFEWVEILRKRNLYQDVQWTKEQKEAFDQYWIKNFGKKISPRWHKLYQSINGTFDVTYLPDVIYSTKIEPQINPYSVAKVLQDKSLIEILSKSVQVKVPKTILLNSYGLFYDEQRRNITKEEAFEILSSTGVVAVKPTVGGSSGNGVKIIDFQSLSQQQRIELLNSYKMNYILQEKINQHSSFAALHPESINTIRLITVASKNGMWHWPLTMRIGAGNAVVDNIHAGGLVIGVSDDGYLKEEAYRLGYCDKKDKYSAHPDSKIVFKNYKLEKIPDIIEVAERLHECFPGIGMISWDLTLSEDGEPIIIEANLSAQGTWFPQIVNKKGMSGSLLNALK